MKPQVETKSEVNTEAPTAAITNAEPAKAEAASEKQRTEAKARIQAIEKPAEPVKAIAGATPAVAPDVKKDTRVAVRRGAAKAEPPKRPGQIAVFISRKDSKLYVRQNFAPLFEVPSRSRRATGRSARTSSPPKSTRPIPTLLHWSVVSLPVAARAAADATMTTAASAAPP